MSYTEELKGGFYPRILCQDVMIDFCCVSLCLKILSHIFGWCHLPTAVNSRVISALFQYASLTIKIKGADQVPSHTVLWIRKYFIRIRIRFRIRCAFWPLDPDPGSGTGFFRIPDLGSRISTTEWNYLNCTRKVTRLSGYPFYRPFPSTSIQSEQNEVNFLFDVTPFYGMGSFFDYLPRLGLNLLYKSASLGVGTVFRQQGSTPFHRVSLWKNSDSVSTVLYRLEFNADFRLFH